MIKKDKSNTVLALVFGAIAVLVFVITLVLKGSLVG